MNARKMDMYSSPWGRALPRLNSLLQNAVYLVVVSSMEHECDRPLAECLTFLSCSTESGAGLRIPYFG